MNDELRFKQFIPIQVRRLEPRAVLPKPAHSGDVGFDLYPCKLTSLDPGKVTVVGTGLALVDFPEAIVENGRVVGVPFAKIEGRSGLASQGVFPVGGIIDPGYRGEIKALMYNSTQSVVWLDESRAMAQLVIYHTLSHVEGAYNVRFIFDGSPTDPPRKGELPIERGTSGFGSTDSAE